MLTNQELIKIIARNEDVETATEIVREGKYTVYENLYDYIETLCAIYNEPIADWIDVNEFGTWNGYLRYDDLNPIAFANAVDNAPNEFTQHEEWRAYMQNLCTTSKVVVYCFD